jgi:hypothetical protein
MSRRLGKPYAPEGISAFKLDYEVSPLCFGQVEIRIWLPVITTSEIDRFIRCFEQDFLQEFLCKGEAQVIDIRRPSITTRQSKLFKTLNRSFASIVGRELNTFISDSPSVSSYSD